MAIKQPQMKNQDNMIYEEISKSHNHQFTVKQPLHFQYISCVSIRRLHKR